MRCHQSTLFGTANWLFMPFAKTTEGEPRNKYNHSTGNVGQRDNWEDCESLVYRKFNGYRV